MISVRLLGPVEVDANGDNVALSRTLERALLARLALHPGQPVSSERLIDDLWGDHAPRDGAASLQGLVYRLRRTLGSERRCIVRADNGYVLDARCGCRRHRPSTSSWLGRVPHRAPGTPRRPRRCSERPSTCGGVPPWPGSNHCPSSSTQATRLNAARLAALGDRVQADLAAGRHREVIAELESLVAEHPYQERFWSQLMLALYRAGSQADALRCYSRLRNLLNEELGIAPGPAVSELEKAILEQDPALAWVPASSPTPPIGGHRVAPLHPTPRHPIEAVAGADAVESSDLSWVPPVGRGRLRGQAGRARRRPRRAPKGGGGRTALDLDHRGARHRQDETDGGDRPRM